MENGSLFDETSEMYQTVLKAINSRKQWYGCFSTDEFPNPEFTAINDSLHGPCPYNYEERLVVANEMRNGRNPGRNSKKSNINNILVFLLFFCLTSLDAIVGMTVQYRCFSPIATWD